MRILVYPHMMELGGSQLNAIELSTRLQRRGHEIVLFSEEGRLVEVARSAGLECVIAPAGRRWPSPRNIAAVRRLVRDRGIELVHGYEAGPAVELALGRTMQPVALVLTCMSMTVPPFMPRRAALVVGTHELVDTESRLRDDVQLMEPPVDLDLFIPADAATRRDARDALGLSPDTVVVSVVCRLHDDLGKLPGVLDAVTVVGDLAQHHDVTLLVIGEGPGTAAVRAAAQRTNDAVGRAVVQTPGALDHPLSAYHASDVALGMGSSAIKALACGLPLVVQGQHGFWRPLDEHTAPDFLRAGWWGDGGRGAEDLRAALEPLVASAALRTSLGTLGRATADPRYGIEAAVDQLEEIYARVAVGRGGRGDLGHVAMGLAKFRTVRALQERAPMLWQAYRRVRDR